MRLRLLSALPFCRQPQANVRVVEAMIGWQSDMTSDYVAQLQNCMCICSVAVRMWVLMRALPVMSVRGNQIVFIFTVITSVCERRTEVVAT